MNDLWKPHTEETKMLQRKTFDCSKKLNFVEFPPGSLHIPPHMQMFTNMKTMGAALRLRKMTHGSHTVWK